MDWLTILARENYLLIPIFLLLCACQVNWNSKEACNTSQIEDVFDFCISCKAQSTIDNTFYFEGLTDFLSKKVQLTRILASSYLSFKLSGLRMIWKMRSLDQILKFHYSYLYFPVSRLGPYFQDFSSPEDVVEPSNDLWWPNVAICG